MLHMALERAVKERLILRNPFDDVILPKEEKKEMKILKPENIGAYLAEAEKRGVLPMFFLDLCSGLRKRGGAVRRRPPRLTTAAMPTAQGVRGFCPDKNYGAVFSALTPGHGAVVPKPPIFQGSFTTPPQTPPREQG